MNNLYQINDLVLYSNHGICKINSITEKTFTDEPKKYYELLPLKDLKLQIHIPVDSDKIQLIDLMNEQEALKLVESFKHETAITLERNFMTSAPFIAIISSTDRQKMVQYIISLMNKKASLDEGKKLPVQENKALQQLQGILYNEIAFALKKTYEDVSLLVDDAIAVNS